MASLISITEPTIFAMLRGFLLDILPAGVEVIRGQANRVPEPRVEDFVVMTPLMRERLSTNVITYAEAKVAGSIAGTVLTVTATEYGVLAPGLALEGDGVAPLSAIVAVLAGTPGAELYRITPSQTVAAGAIYAGGATSEMSTKVTIQLDVHGPLSADNAQVIATLLRDPFASQQFARFGIEVVPLYATEPKQMPFINAEQQYEFRWVLDAVLQAKPAVTTPQQFAGALSAGLINVDVVFPPGAP